MLYRDALRQRARDRLAQLAIVNRGMAGGEAYGELYRQLREEAGL